MKLAHLILAHNNPLQLSRLIKRLSHPDADVYIHLDAKADIAAYEPVKNISNTFFIKKRVNVIWGEYSVMQATFNGIVEMI